MFQLLNTWPSDGKSTLEGPSGHFHSSRVRMVRIVPYERYVRILTYLILGYMKGT